MYFGGSLFIFAIGAILAFAVNESVQGVDLQLVGWILMGVAVVGIILSFVANAQRRGGPPPPNEPPRDY